MEEIDTLEEKICDFGDHILFQVHRITLISLQAS